MRFFKPFKYLRLPTLLNFSITGKGRHYIAMAYILAPCFELMGSDPLNFDLIEYGFYLRAFDANNAYINALTDRPEYQIEFANFVYETHANLTYLRSRP
jgi:hypothetical protein